MTAIAVERNIPSMPLISAMLSSTVMQIIAVSVSSLRLAISVDLRSLLRVTKATVIGYHRDPVSSSALIMSS
jgi:hypothetical protein